MILVRLASLMMSKKQYFIYMHSFSIFFFNQWTAIKSYANEKGIKIIGDLPIYVAPDSSDVWENPQLFQLDENGTFSHVAGVPQIISMRTDNIGEIRSTIGMFTKMIIINGGWID